MENCRWVPKSNHPISHTNRLALIPSHTIIPKEIFWIQFNVAALNHSDTAVNDPPMSRLLFKGWCFFLTSQIFSQESSLYIFKGWFKKKTSHADLLPKNPLYPPFPYVSSITTFKRYTGPCQALAFDLRCQADGNPNLNPAVPKTHRNVAGGPHEDYLTRASLKNQDMVG